MEVSHARPPLIIGGTGGSGTRVVAALCRSLGAHLGSNLNSSLDCTDFIKFHERWINVCLSGSNEINEFIPPNEFFIDLYAIKNTLQSSCTPESIWGWKAPRSLLIVPQLIVAFPRLKYIQVVRDGRDMAFSSNQNQLIKHGEAIFGQNSISERPEIRSIALWQWANMRAVRAFRERPRNQHLIIRYEDLCKNPLNAAQRIANFSGLNSRKVTDADVEIVKSPRSGEWRKSPLRSKITSQALEGLKYFNYV